VTVIWPWLAVASMGALHGLNPATGWGLLVTVGARAGGRGQAWRALLPIALGHIAAIGLVLALAALGLFAERGLLPWIAGALAAVLALAHVSGRLHGRLHRIAGQAGLALSSLASGAIHGAGMMLAPALLPLCVSGSPVREIAASGSLTLALVAVALHMAAMLAVSAVAASAVRSGWRMVLRLPGRHGDRRTK